MLLEGALLSAREHGLADVAEDAGAFERGEGQEVSCLSLNSFKYLRHATHALQWPWVPELKLLAFQSDILRVQHMGKHSPGRLSTDVVFELAESILVMS